MGSTPAARNGPKFSPTIRGELLDPESWREVLTTYARTTRLAVALIDAEGRQLGECYNPQPVWKLVHEARSERAAKCPFCMAPEAPCVAVAEALQTTGVVMAHDRAGLAHVAVPLTLEGQGIGGLIAGQVFDRFPEPLRLQRVAREFGVPAQGLWQAAIRQAPLSGVVLRVYGDLLLTLGQAFLRQRYGAIVQRDLADVNRRFRLLINSAKDYAFLTLDAAGRVSGWNTGAELLFGYTEDEILGREYSRLFAPEEIQKGAPGAKLDTTLRDGSVQAEHWLVRKDGTRFLASSTMSASTSGKGLEFGLILHDMTTLRNTQRELAEAQKLESIGALAAGIAHDFNNVLAGIVINASILLEDSDPLSPNRPAIDDILAASELASGLTGQLLAYAGKRPFGTTRLDLSKLIAEMLHLLQSSIPKNVTLQSTLARDLPPIDADASQIQQIVLNLVINGGEAIGVEGGVVQVSTGVGVPGAWQECAGPYVYMEVRDSGCGMEEAACARIFDPFFSTKFVGRGLGLAAVAGAVRAHKGEVKVTSAPGEGSVFRIFLPALEPAALVESAAGHA
jgi:PAS domain S-box-containing protein